MKETALILEATNTLVNIIKNTSVYTEFQSALEDLQKYPELKTLADEFRTQKFLAYHSLKEQISFADFPDFEEKRLELAGYPQIERYLNAEVALCRLLQEVESCLTEGMSFD